MTDSHLPIEIDGWTVRVRIPDGRGQHRVFLMLHGWTGDEKVMWVFGSKLPEKYLLVAPRAPYTAQQGGYGWQPRLHHELPHYRELAPAVDNINELLDRLAKSAELAGGEFRQIHLMGFSQGAALAYTYALLHPERVGAVIGLAGFMPGGVSALVETRPLAGKSMFVAHGTLDETVPVARARQAVELLERAGANVTYCEDEVGHKLGASCFRGVGAFAAGLPD